MTFKTTTLTAVFALTLGLDAAVAQQTRTITVPIGSGAEQAAAGDGWTFVATPEGTEPVAAEAVGSPPATAPGRLVQTPVGSTEIAPTPVPDEPPQVSEDGAADPSLDDRPIATGTADPAAGELVNEPQPGTLTPETGQSPSPVAVEGEAAADADEAAAEAEPAPAADATDATVASEAEGEAAAASEGAPEDEAVASAEDDTSDAAPAGEEAGAEATGADVDAAAESAADGGVVEPDVEEIEAAAPEAEEPAAAHQEITDVNFSFEGPFGRFDQFQLQRGLQVYTEVCSACHGLKYVPLRTLSDPGGPGLPEDQVRAYAAMLEIEDAETGEFRPRLPTDHFPAVTGEGMGPDLSVMAKARAGFHGPYGTGLSQLFNGMGGPEYIYSILTHYTGEEKEEAGSFFYENTSFPGGWIAMSPPLFEDGVTFADGTPATLENQAKDVAAFLMWTAEPKMMARKQAGLVSVVFLIGLTVLLYLTNKRIWRSIKYGRRTE